MKAAIIRTKLAKFLHKESDTILLEVISGKPRSLEGGSWIEVNTNDMEILTDGINFDPVISGWKKYLDKWHAEGLITTKEKDTGKS